MSTRADTTSIQLRTLASRPSTVADPEGNSGVLHVTSREGQGERDPLLLSSKILSEEALSALLQRQGKKSRNKKLAAFYEGQNEVRFRASLRCWLLAEAGSARRLCYPSWR